MLSLKAKRLRGWKRAPKPLHGLPPRDLCARPCARRGSKRPSVYTFPPITATARSPGSSGAYLFVRNSESGRRTLYSSSNIPEIADRITRYMAHEIVHRERMEGALAEPGRASRLGLEPAPARTRMGVVIAAFAIGVVTGAVGLFAAVMLSLP